MRAEKLTNEQLASHLRTMCNTGSCPSRSEKEFLLEAADRLEQSDIERLSKKLGVKLL